jgi:hypothetical protein
MIQNFDVIIKKIQTISQAQDLVELGIQFVAPQRASWCNASLGERIFKCFAACPRILQRDSQMEMPRRIRQMWIK